MTPRYSMMIRWSTEDQSFVVLLPEFSDVSQPCTHGVSYEEAARNGRDAIESLVEDYQARGKPLRALSTTPADSA
ncbi:MAG: type II toxin-antitoxin system HicB family antitoxin [Isosphaeraceae bacterium]|nr:type II toxin-antitoxin system HicB family antitoxin [Isosphaeraceae bacterium]